MFFVSLLMLFICLFFDITIHLYIGDFLLTSRLCIIFLCYTALRRGFGTLLFLLFVYALTARTFSGLGFSTIFFPALITTSVFYKLRLKIYTESYLVQGIWVCLMAFLHWVLLYVIDFKTLDFLIMPALLLDTILNCFIAAVVALALFAGWDMLFDRARRGRRGSDDSGLGINLLLQGKNHSGDLL